MSSKYDNLCAYVAWQIAGHEDDLTLDQISNKLIKFMDEIQEKFPDRDDTFYKHCLWNIQKKFKYGKTPKVPKYQVSIID